MAATCVMVLGACESDFVGSRFDNLAPDTQLSVRDSTLVDNLGGGERLSSTVFAAWTGDDPDGFVDFFEVRFYPPLEQPPADDGWIRTLSRDSLVLLPIPPGQKTADIVFEARAVDNDGLRDPSPARTVYPIQNSPPTITLSSFDVAPDTTYAIFSFAWRVDDPEGFDNLDRVDVSLNDSLEFVGIPPDVDFVTFVGAVDKNDPLQSTTNARVFLGRGFQSTELRVPGLRLDAANTFFARAVDKTDTTSALISRTWHVKKSNSDILYVNDYRKATSPTVQFFHLELLREYLAPSTPIDIWDISTPFVSGSAGNTPRSGLLHPNADPTIRQALADYRYIYWVSTNTISSVTGDNMPFVAGVLDLFFEAGGKMMVHSIVSNPANPEDILGNPAFLLLPLTDLVTFPDTLRPALRMANGSNITPVDPVPGQGVTLPALKANAFLINTLPYVVEGNNLVPLARGQYTYITTRGAQGPWTGPSNVASISADRRVGLFALPLVNEQNGTQTLIGADGNTEAPRDAVKLMLESLGFPR